MKQKGVGWEGRKKKKEMHGKAEKKQEKQTGTWEHKWEEKHNRKSTGRETIYTPHEESCMRSEEEEIANGRQPDLWLV